MLENSLPNSDCKSADKWREILAEMVADEAFAELCQSIGEEPEWLKKARTLLATLSVTEGAINQPRQDEAQNLRYAKQIAEYIREKYFPDVPQWKPLTVYRGKRYPGPMVAYHTPQDEWLVATCSDVYNVYPPRYWKRITAPSSLDATKGQVDDAN